MSGDDLIDEVLGLGFRCPPEALREFLDQATRSRLGPAEVLGQLAVLEWRERDRRNLATRTRKALLGSHSTVDRFDWNHPREIDRGLFESLIPLEFLRRGENVLFRGQAGVGKTTLAQNLGQVALTAGYTVLFTTLAAALADLLKQESLPAMERRMRRYVTPHLLIIDEIGYIPCDSRSADVLYNIISRRHERTSTIVTTNLAFKLWATVFPGAACVAALIDRFSQRLHVIDIDADSYRPKKGKEPPNPPPTAARVRNRRRPAPDASEARCAT
jgi:DNA replication protein DnaC